MVLQLSLSKVLSFTKCISYIIEILPMTVIALKAEQISSIWMLYASEGGTPEEYAYSNIIVLHVCVCAWVCVCVCVCVCASDSDDLSLDKTAKS